MGTLTSTETDRLAAYTVGASASTGPFPITFPFADNDDIAVYVNGIKISTYAVTQGSAYGTSGNFVTLETGVTNSTVSVVSEASAVRSTTDSLTLTALNGEIDNIYANLQENQFDKTRSMNAPLTDPTTSNMTLPSYTARAGRLLGFNSTTGNPEAGPSITAAQTLSAASASINLLGTAAVVEDMGLLSASAVIEDMGLLATAAIIEDMGLLATSAVIEDMGLLATSAVIEDMGLLGTSANVTAMGLLGNSTVITNISNLSASAVIADMALLGTSAVVEDMGFLGNSTTIGNMNLLGTSDAVSDMNTLATSSNVTNQNTLAGISGNITTVAGISANVTTVAGDASDINTLVAALSNINLVASNINSGVIDGILDYGAVNDSVSSSTDFGSV